MGRLGRLYCCIYKSVTLNARSSATIECSVDNGGPAGVLYELLVACFYYALIAASIAEVPFSTLLSFMTNVLPTIQ